MPITLDGTTGYLQHNARIATGFPFTILVYFACPSPNSSYQIAGQGASASDTYNAAGVASYTTNKQALHRHVGGSRSATKSTTPDVSTTTLLPIVAVYTSASSRTIYFGSSTGVTDTTAGTDNTSLHDRVVVGAYKYNTGTASSFLKGDVAEAHYYSTALSSAEVGDLVSATVLPEATAGWIDGWALETYSAGGTYTSIGGSRTLTASGTSSTSGLTHPVTRAGDTTAPILTSAVGTQTGSTTATVGATTDEGNGTMYAVVTVSGTAPSVAQIQAGQDNSGTAAAYASSQAITTTGAKTFSATGLAASTAYYAHIQHKDAAANDSTVVSSAQFTTAAGAGASAQGAGVARRNQSGINSFGLRR
jgi:hypothetical protein